MGRRRTLTFAVVSGLLLLVTLYGWLESCRPVLVRSYRGKLLVLFVDPMVEPGFSDVHGEAAGQFVAAYRGQARFDANWAGFEFFHETNVTLCAVPYPYLVLLTAGLSAYAILRARRQRARAVQNRCLACGYDLRATTAGRCPECGTPCPAAPPSP